MKHYKKLGLALMVTGTLALSALQSCKKYPDGPMISLHSRTERVVNTWKVDNYKLNDVDYTSAMSGYTETFTKSGAYSFSWGALSGTGIWGFQNNDNEILVSGVSGQSSRTLVILKLEEKQFWYYFMDGTDRHELHLIQ